MFGDNKNAPNAGMPLPAGSAVVDPNAPGYRPVGVKNMDAGVQNDLDDILNAALDELEDDDLGGAGDGMKTKAKPKDGQTVDLSDQNAAAQNDRMDKNMESENKQNAQNAMNELLDDLQVRKAPQDTHLASQETPLYLLTSPPSPCRTRYTAVCCRTASRR